MSPRPLKQGQRWLTISQAAVYVGRSRPTVYEWIAAGKVRVRQEPSGWRSVFRPDLDRVLREEAGELPA